MAINIEMNMIMNRTIDSVKSVIPLSIGIDQPSVIQQPFLKETMNVLIEITGTITGHIVIEGQEQVFTKIGEVMYGMTLEGEMLHSFTGELGNMIAGNLATAIAQQEVELDITPPSLTSNTTHLASYEKALSLPIHFSSAGTFSIILLFKEQKEQAPV